MVELGEHVRTLLQGLLCQPWRCQPPCNTPGEETPAIVRLEIDKVEPAKDQLILPHLPTVAGNRPRSAKREPRSIDRGVNQHGGQHGGQQHGAAQNRHPSRDVKQLVRHVPRPRPPRSQDNAVLPAGSQPMLLELREAELAFQATGHQFTDAFFRIPIGGRVTTVLRPQQITRHDGRSLGSDDMSGLFAAMPVGLGGDEIVGLFGATPSRPPSPRSEWRLFRGRPRADDVQQGELGDCWFLSSLAALAEFQHGRFVRALLPGQETVSQAGAYVVRLCLGGRWTGVLVDDLLPCLGGGMYHTQLAYCVTKRQQLWASIIEKGFAKACGSYEALRGGEASEALEMLTGWPCSMIIFERPDFDPEMLWAALCSARDVAFLMICSTKTVRSRSLEADHVYSLLDVQEVVSSRGDLVRLLKIRNPHARSKWQGAWSDSSALWTPHLRRQLDCPEGGRPQVFFMAFDDFLLEFAHCTICKIQSSEWHEARMPVELPGGCPRTGLEVEASEMTECSISLMQPGQRLRGGAYHPQPSEPAACIGFILLRLEGGHGGLRQGSVVALAQMQHSGAVSTDCWLPPGRYLLVPLSVRRGLPLPATWAFVSSKKVKLSERKLEQEALKTAWMAYARETDPQGEDFHGAVLRLGKSEAGAVVVLVENLTDKHLRVQFAFKSDCLRFSRGKSEVIDWLAPGYGQILQVAQPSSDLEKPVFWSETHTFRMTPHVPQQAWHNPPINPIMDLHGPMCLTEPASHCQTQ